jgi:hypothetical protein
MADINSLAERYIMVWNEPDAARRRKAIAELWAPAGAYVDPVHNACGYDALYATVTEIHEEFIRPGKFLFRSRRDAQAHHLIARMSWEMADIETHKVVDGGLDLFVLDGEGRILADYKFMNPPMTTSEFNEFTERYLRLWQEPDRGQRRALITELWAAEGTQIYPAGEPRGHEELFDRVTRSYDLFIRPGEYRFRRAGDADGHHNLVRFNWEMVRHSDGGVADAGFELFVRDDGGRILADYQFIGPMTAPAQRAAGSAEQ